MLPWPKPRSFMRENSGSRIFENFLFAGLKRFLCELHYSVRPEKGSFEGRGPTYRRQRGKFSLAFEAHVPGTSTPDRSRGLPQNRAELVLASGFRLCRAHRRIRSVAAMIHFPAHPATVASLWRGGSELLRNRLRPLFEVIDSGSRIFRMNTALFSLWLLFPLFLILTSDWIGLLVVFQAMTAAVRLRSAPAAKALAVSPCTSVSANRVEGEYRVL